jgi:hypothetical protein
MAKDAKDVDLDELAQQMHLRADSMAHLAAHAEFIRRQTEARLEAADATIIAARAEEMAAEAKYRDSRCDQEKCKVFALGSDRCRHLGTRFGGRSLLLLLEHSEISPRWTRSGHHR